MHRKIKSLIADVREVVDVAGKLYRLGTKVLGDAFPRKVRAVRIPSCCGYFQRKEDDVIRSELKTLCKNGNFSCVKTLILYGPTGHGKEYSAANVMNQLYTNTLRLRSSWSFRRERPTILWTINANNQTTMLESYLSLAKEIGLREEANVANQELSLLSRTSEGRQYHINLQTQCQQNAYDEALKQIYEEVMKNLRHHSPWVLLIKGPTEDMPRFKRFWPQPGDPNFGNGLVIMTTQCRPKLLPKEEGDYSMEVSIGEMANEDAVAFLASKSGIPATGNDKKHAEDIAVKKLHCNPQDIAQFGAFVREYKKETNKQLTFRDLWRTETETLSECMLILELTRTNQAKLLKFLACCSSGNYLPLKILERCFTEATEAAKDSEVVDISERDGIKVATIHSRTHATLRDILTRQQPTGAEQTWMDVFRLALTGNGETNIKTPTLSCVDVSQVIKCLSSVCKDALQRNRDEDFVMLRFILPHLKEAVQLSSKLTVEGELEPRVMADGHACLGESLLFSGESEEARSHLKIALAMYKDYKGPENVQLDLANVLHFLGEAYSNSHLGDPLKGEIYLREALEKKMDFYNGKADPQVAFTLRSLGNVLNELGQQSEAIVLIERALEMYDDSENFSNLKQEYGYTLSALGSSYRYLGRYVQAEDCLKKALKIFRSVDSPSKLRIGVTLSRLSSVQRNMDKLDESIESLNEALEMFGYNDIYSAVILSKLSVVYRYKGDSKTSFDFAEKVKVISDKQHGTKHHPAIATALLNLGHAQSDVGDAEEAVRNLTNAKKIYVALHGKNHRIVAATLNYLGYAYQQMGKVQEGKETLESAVQIMKESHPEVANSLKRLSKACLILGETVRSAELAYRALKIYKKTYENTMEHREVRKCAVRVAYACSKIGLFDKAKEYLKEVDYGFPVEKKSHPEFAAFLRKKTEIILDSFEFNYPSDEQKVQEILSKANTDLLRAEQIVLNSLGHKHQQFAITKKEKARLNILMGNNEIAYDEIRSALRIIPNVSHYLKGEFSLIRGDAEKELSLISAQKESLETAVNTYKKAFGDNHPMVVFALQKQCTRYLDLKQKADQHFEASEQACEILKSDLREQLDSCNTDFLSNYNIDTHPILRRQRQLSNRITRNQGAW